MEQSRGQRKQHLSDRRLRTDTDVEFLGRVILLKSFLDTFNCISLQSYAQRRLLEFGLSLVDVGLNESILTKNWIWGSEAVSLALQSCTLSL